MGTVHVPQSWKPSSEMIPPKSQRPKYKAVPSLWVQLADILPSKILFAKDKLPDGFMFPPVAIATSLDP
jgi:hypothetical protein